VKDQGDDEQLPVFRIAKAMMEAGRLAAGLEDEELADRMDLVVAMKVAPDENAEAEPEGGIFSLSMLDEKPHLQTLMEVTQVFAKQTGYPLEMMIVQKDPQQG
jgi:hypothetical protein